MANSGTVAKSLRTVVVLLLLFGVYIFAFISLIPYATVHTPEGRPMPDYIAFYVGAHIAKSGQVANLYDLDLQRDYWDSILGLEKTSEPRGILSFRLPPTSAYLYSPIAYFNDATAFWIITAVTALSIVASLLILVPLSTFRRLHVQGILIALPVFLPFWQVFIGAQPGGVMLLVLSLIYCSLKKEKYLLAGLITGLLFIKPNFLLIAPFIFVSLKTKRQMTNYFFGTSASVGFMVFINSLIYGVHFLPYYLKYLVETETLMAGTALKHSINPMALTALLTPDEHYAKWAGFGLSAILIMLALFVIYKKRHAFDLEQLFIISVLFLPILNMHTMMSDLIVYIIPMVLLASRYLAQGVSLKFVTLAVLFYIMPLFAFVNMEVIVTLFYLFIAFGLLFRGFPNLVFGQVANIGNIEMDARTTE